MVIDRSIKKMLISYQDAEYVETPTENVTTPSQNFTATPTPSQNSTAQPTPSQNSTTQPTPSQNSTASSAPSHNSTAKPPSPQDSEAAGQVVPLNGGRPRQFAETGNTNLKRGLPLVPERNSPLWSVNADTRLTLPQPQQYDDMGGKTQLSISETFLSYIDSRHEFTLQETA